MSEAAALRDVSVRSVTAQDEGAIRELVAAAFPSDAEARLVETLRHCGALVLEQVAVDPSGSVLGHVAYSRVTPAAVGSGQALKISCLAPVSVWPDKQRQGVGSALIRASLDTLRHLAEDLVLVLGYPAYYPRFGFDPELARQIKGPYAGDAFMALALTDAGRDELPLEVAFATPFEEFE